MVLHDALVRLAADRRLRDAFLADPRGALAGLDLAADAVAALVALDRPALVRYAESLLDKRVEELATALPISTRLYPPLRAMYRRWLAVNPAPHRDDALTPGLREALRALPALLGRIEPPWVAEVVAFEALSRASARDGRRRTLRTRWPADRLLAEVAAGEIPLDPDEDPRVHELP